MVGEQGDADAGRAAAVLSGQQVGLVECVEDFFADNLGLRGGFLGTWTPGWNELKGARSITFPVLVQEQAGDAAAIRFLSTMEEQSRALRPVIR